jgi:hypothetical protein
MMISIRAFGLLQLAEDDRARILQPCHHGRILAWMELAMDGHAVRSRRTLDPAKILDRNRNAMQRTLDPAGCDFLLCSRCFRQRGISRDIGVALEFAIEPLDPLEHRPGYFNRRQLLRMDLLSDLDQSEIVNICRRHCFLPTLIRPAHCG